VGICLGLGISVTASCVGVPQPLYEMLNSILAMASPAARDAAGSGEAS
jgi:hypothetical protein